MNAADPIFRLGRARDHRVGRDPYHALVRGHRSLCNPRGMRSRKRRDELLSDFIAVKDFNVDNRARDNIK